MERERLDEGYAGTGVDNEAVGSAGPADTEIDLEEEEGGLESPEAADGAEDVAERASDPLLASETLARLLEEQGLSQQAARVRAAASSGEEWGVVAISESGLDWEGLKVKRAREGILCRWFVSPAKVGSARSVVETEDGSRPELALRVVSSRAGAAGQWDLRPIKESGFCVLGREPRPDWVVAAVGLRLPTGRFFPLVHSHVVRLSADRKTEEKR